jgi:5-oxoprolinase (ATP-hydrolysing)
VVERFAQRQVLEPLAAVAGRVGEWLDELAAEAVRAVAAEGIPEGEIEVRRRLAALRFVGQDTPVTVEAGGDLQEAFAVAYRDLYGYQPEDRDIEVESLRVVASSSPSSQTQPGRAATGGRPNEGPRARPRVHLGNAWQEVPAYERDRLPEGEIFEGPALVFERHTAVVVPPGWRGRLDCVGTLVLER